MATLGGIEPMFSTRRRALVVFGAGGLARQLPALVDDINRQRRSHRIIGFLDARPSPVLDVIGEDGRLAELDADFAIGIANPQVRERLDRFAATNGSAPALLRHPSSSLESRVSIGPGCIVMPGVRIQADASVGRQVFVNANAVIGHDSLVGDYASLSPLTMLGGGTVLETRVFIGAGAVVLPGVTVGTDAVVGAGAVVTHDVPPGAVVAGVPARPIGP